MDSDNDRNDDNESDKQGGNPLGFLTGVILGGMIGLAAGIMIAPTSGETTRHKLRDQAVSARDEAVQRAEEARAKARDLEASSLEMLEMQKRRVLRTAEAVKRSAQEAWTADGDAAQPMAAAAPFRSNGEAGPGSLLS